MSGAHLDEWQRRSFDISSGNCTPEQTADAYRAHILSIQYAWASSQLSQAGMASLLRTYSERYATVLDSDDPTQGLTTMQRARCIWPAVRGTTVTNGSRP